MILKPHGIPLHITAICLENTTSGPFTNMV